MPALELFPGCTVMTMDTFLDVVEEAGPLESDLIQALADGDWAPEPLGLENQAPIKITNTGRAEMGKKALLPYIDGSNGDEAGTIALVDLLANLMHSANAMGVDFDAALESARDHYQDEGREA